MIPPLLVLGSPTNKTASYDGLYRELATVSRTGHTFAGWFDGETGGNKVRTIDSGRTGDRVSCARWTMNPDIPPENESGGPTGTGGADTGVMVEASGNTVTVSATAKRLAISNGTGGDLYSLEREISREEMFTLLYGALKVLGRLPGVVLVVPSTLSPTAAR